MTASEETVGRVTMTRRELLQSAAAGALAAAAGVPAGAAAPRTLGVQLYTVRDQLEGKTDEVLRAIAEIGYEEVEALDETLDRVAPAAKAIGLSPVSVHVDAAIITRNPEGDALAAAIRDAQQAGARYMVLPYLQPTEREGGAPFYTKLAETLNEAGRRIKGGGLQLCYHNHGFEFEPLPDGRRPLDLLMASVDPALVKLELDVFWTAITGADPVALIKQYSDRIALLHLKDKARGVGPETQESRVPQDAFTEVGAGTIDFPAILAAAASAGVEHYFVEQDYTPGDPIASLRKSYLYLAGLR